MSEELRKELLDALLQQGFALSGSQLVPPDTSCKLYARLRLERLKEARSWLLPNEVFAHYFYKLWEKWRKEAG